MNEFTIVLSDAELKAMSIIALDPQQYIDNAIHDRCRIAIDEVYAAEVARMTADPDITSIPADKDAVVLAADVQTAAERQAAMETELAAGNP